MKVIEGKEKDVFKPVEIKIKGTTIIIETQKEFDEIIDILDDDQFDPGSTPDIFYNHLLTALRK